MEDMTPELWDGVYDRVKKMCSANRVKDSSGILNELDALVNTAEEE